MQVASIGLLGAIDRFDPERGREFTTFAVPTIIGELKRYYRDHGWAMKVMRGDKERVLALIRATEELSARDGHAPTPIELAEHTGIDLDAVLDALELAVAARPSSLEEPAGGADGEPGTLGASLGGDDPELELVESRDVVASSVRTLTAARAHGSCTSASSTTSRRPRSARRSASARCRCRASCASRSSARGRTRRPPPRARTWPHRTARPRSGARPG